VLYLECILYAFMSIFEIFYYSIFFFSLYFFLSLYWIYYVHCYGRPALMDVCLHWQPAIAVIVVHWSINSLSLVVCVGAYTDKTLIITVLPMLLRLPVLS